MKTQSESHVNPEVVVKVFGGLRERSGQSSFRIPFTPGLSVEGVLAFLDHAQPALASALRAGLKDGYLNILVNGRNVRFLKGAETELAAADSVAFLPPIGGG
jgi:MoaD family protein